MSNETYTISVSHVPGYAREVSIVRVSDRLIMLHLAGAGQYNLAERAKVDALAERVCKLLNESEAQS